jgi:hypothetical protein
MSAPIQDNVPEFARGSSFEAIIKLPDSVEENYFDDWQALSQIREEGNLSKAGLIGDLSLTWLGPREFKLSSDDTDKWRLGMAEFDVLFSSNKGRIKAGITQ